MLIEALASRSQMMALFGLVSLLSERAHEIQIQHARSEWSNLMWMTLIDGHFGAAVWLLGRSSRNPSNIISHPKVHSLDM